MRINTLARHGRYLREGEDGGGGNNQQQQSEYKPPATQAELDRIIEQRLSRDRSRYADYETIKAKADQFDLLAEESKTDREREIAEARAEAFQEAMSKTVPVAVKAEFRAAAKGALTPEQLESLLEDLDLTRYAKEDGEPDSEKIAKKISAIAPANGGGGSNGGPGFGQGGGYQQSQPKRGEAGIAEAVRRFGEEAVLGRKKS